MRQDTWMSRAIDGTKRSSVARCAPSVPPICPSVHPHEGLHSGCRGGGVSANDYPLQVQLGGITAGNLICMDRGRVPVHISAHQISKSNRVTN